MNNGKSFERLIQDSADLYSAEGLAHLFRLEHGGRVVRDKSGKYHQIKLQVPCDFIGTLRGGQSVMVECKSRANMRLTPGGKERSIRFDKLLNEYQQECLFFNEQMGGLSIVALESVETTGPKWYAAPYRQGSIFGGAWISREIPIRRGVLDVLNLMKPK